MSTEEPRKMYRYADRLVATWNYDYDQPNSSYPEVYLEEWYIVKETPHTYLLGISPGGGLVKRRMYKKAQKRFAFENPLMAAKDYMRRKTFMVSLMRKRLQTAEQLLGSAKVLVNGGSMNGYLGPKARITVQAQNAVSQAMQKVQEDSPFV